MSVDADTIAFYDGHAAEYADYAAPQASHPRLARFIAAMPEGGRVLDFGAGTGWAAQEMIAAGLRTDATDASAGLGQEAQRRYGVTVRRAGFTTLSARQRYDGIWAHFSLQHALREERATVFERLGTALRPGGLLYVGVQKGPMDWRDGFGRLYCPFRQEELDGLLTANGLTPEEFEQGTGRNFDGKPTLGLYVWARRDG